MFIDFSHNKLVCELITDSFKRAIEERVAPLLAAKYSDSLVGIQLYEDYIADGLILDGSVYYPLTVVTDGGYETEWICAPFVEGDFPHGAMFTYCGEGELDVTLASAPKALEAKLSGRRRYFDGKSLSVNITSPVGAATLAGKYSQSFLDLLGERITAEIERVMSVSGLVDSGIYIEMPFAPETYMEHTSESVTFRRLLISDKTSSAKDLFIRWKRLDGKVGYTVSDTPDESNIEIALGEDVPQKIREREYRFLTRVSPNRYQTAMGRKNVTEWRELIKRAIKRGELVKVETPEDKKLAEVSDKLTEIFREIGQPLDTTPAEEIISPEYDEDFERAMQALREVANGEMPTAAPTVEPTAEEAPEAEAELEAMLTPFRTYVSEYTYTGGVFTAPVEGKITTSFGLHRYTNGSSEYTIHNGQDIAAKGNPDIKASKDGKVVYVGQLQVPGNTVIIDHGLNILSYYYYMKSTQVEVGQIVSQGEKIGVMGTTGYSTGDHLHYTVMINGVATNPVTLYDVDPSGEEIK
ncbi:MAG: M23 family metallopeptidase [Clostridia bacterium]|nr:M23 family metallopeptidase [Clostridia bacterium]